MTMALDGDLGGAGIRAGSLIEIMSGEASLR